MEDVVVKKNKWDEEILSEDEEDECVGNEGYVVFFEEEEEEFDLEIVDEKWLWIVKVFFDCI